MKKPTHMKSATVDALSEKVKFSRQAFDVSFCHLFTDMKCLSKVSISAFISVGTPIVIDFESRLMPKKTSVMLGHLSF